MNVIFVCQVKFLTDNIQIVLDAVRTSQIVEVQVFF
jgi:hypothetical protein